jgi:hypothetical protein
LTGMKRPVPASLPIFLVVVFLFFGISVTPVGVGRNRANSVASEKLLAGSAPDSSSLLRLGLSGSDGYPDSPSDLHRPTDGSGRHSDLDPLGHFCPPSPG